MLKTVYKILLQIFLQANDARKELLEKEKEASELKLESMGLKQDLKLANDQCVLLFNEVQKAWKVSFTLQSDLKVCSTMLFSYCVLVKHWTILQDPLLSEVITSESCHHSLSVFAIFFGP